jgi:hypothetical protein
MAIENLMTIAASETINVPCQIITFDNRMIGQDSTACRTSTEKVCVVAFFTTRHLEIVD